MIPPSMSITNFLNNIQKWHSIHFTDVQNDMKFQVQVRKRYWVFLSCWWNQDKQTKLLNILIPNMHAEIIYFLYFITVKKIGF